MSSSRSTVPQPAERPLGRVLGFMRVLWALDHRLNATSKHMLAKLGVTGSQRMAIRLIARFDGISAGELAELLHLHPSTLTGVIEKLGRAGMVDRVRDPDDARRIRLSLTDEGWAIDRVQRGTVEAAVRRALSQATEEEISAATSLLKKLADELDEDASPRRRSGREVTP